MSLNNAIVAGTTFGNATAIHTHSGGNDEAITCLFAYNSSASPVTIHVYVGSGALSAQQQIIRTEIAAYDTFVINLEKLILSTGDKVSAWADVDAVVFINESYLVL